MRALLVQSPATSPWVPRQQWEPPSIALATIAGQIEQMRHFTNLNDFGREIQGRSGGDSYHPIFGTQEDPFADTRLSLLKKRLAVFGHSD